MIIPKLTKDVFRLLRKQEEKRRSIQEEMQEKKYSTDAQYGAYICKKNMGKIDKFNSRDLVYYFRDRSVESGNRYIITSFTKDMAIMKRLKNDLENEEIVRVIDFLFSGDCDYLKSPTINILGSSWINSLLDDSKSWVDGTYRPRKKGGKRNAQIEAREYKKEEKVEVSASKKSERKSKVRIGKW